MAKKPSKQAASDANMAAIKHNGGLAEYKEAAKSEQPLSAFPAKQRKGAAADRKRLHKSIEKAGKEPTVTDYRKRR